LKVHAQKRRSDEVRKPDLRGKVIAEAAYAGVPGAYSHIALTRAFPSAKATAYPKFSDAFQIVSSGKAHCALLPVENSIEGSVMEVHDLLLQHDVVALAEVFLAIRHMLIANPGTTMDQIKKVYSHWQALAQCRDYITARGYEAIEYGNTAAAVEMLKAKGMNDAAAIASEDAATRYGMPILERGIEDQKGNCTRFLLIARTEEEEDVRRMMRINGSGPCKTSLVLGLNHEPGALYKMLGEFAERGINLTKINSRPTREKPWEYVFHVDFEGDRKTGVVRNALEAVGHLTTFLKVVGSYRVAYDEQQQAAGSA